MKITKLDKLAIKITQWAGSVESLITHTIIFASFFLLSLFGISINTILLILTTIVSLEAIYLAILIQMTVNNDGNLMENIEDDIEEIKEDLEQLNKK